MNTKAPNGRELTQALFYEMGNGSHEYAIYTLKDEDIERDGVLYLSLFKLYMDCEDPTEYNFAMAAGLSWRQWEAIRSNKAIKAQLAKMKWYNGFDDWADELEVKIRSKAVCSGIKASNTGNFQATKWVAEYGWRKRAPGAPSKEEKTKAAKIDERVNSHVDELYERMGVQ